MAHISADFCLQLFYQHRRRRRSVADFPSHFLLLVWLQINGFPNRKRCSQWISPVATFYNCSVQKQPLTLISNLVKGFSISISIGPRSEIVIGIWAAPISPPVFILQPFIWLFFCFKTIFASNIHHVSPFTLLLSVIFFSSNSFFHQITSRFYSTSVGLVVLLCVSNIIKLTMLHLPCIYLLASFHCHSPLFQICLPLWVILSIFQFGTVLPAAPSLVCSAQASCDVPPFNQTPFSSIKTLSQAETQPDEGRRGCKWGKTMRWKSKEGKTERKITGESLKWFLFAALLWVDVRGSRKIRMVCGDARERTKEMRSI